MANKMSNWNLTLNLLTRQLAPLVVVHYNTRHRRCTSIGPGFATMDQREACEVGKKDAVTQQAAGKHEFWVRFFRSGFGLRHVNRTQPEG